jgi:hypothetical protein
VANGEAVEQARQRLSTEAPIECDPEEMKRKLLAVHSLMLLTLGVAGCNGTVARDEAELDRFIDSATNVTSVEIGSFAGTNRLDGTEARSVLEALSKPNRIAVSQSTKTAVISWISFYSSSNMVFGVDRYSSGVLASGRYTFTLKAERGIPPAP